MHVINQPSLSYEEEQVVLGASSVILFEYPISLNILLIITFIICF